MKTKVSFCCSPTADLMTLYADRLVPAADIVKIYRVLNGDNPAIAEIEAYFTPIV
jgi:hypothetical protein